MARANQASAESAPAGDNNRYEQCKADLDRLEAIKAEKSALTKEANGIIDKLEKEGGINRGALGEIRRMLDLSPAAIAAREESRKELFSWLVAPKLEEAEAGRDGE